MSQPSPFSLSATRVGPTIREVADYWARFPLSFGHGTDNAYDEAGWLVFAVAELEHAAAEVSQDIELSADVRQKIEALAVRRATERRPLAYLLGEAWFAGLRFYVDERVLVPRSPLAELIHSGFAPWLEDAALETALDIGTGSGCIAIALAATYPDLAVTASDISVDALAVAERNVALHDVGDRVTLVAADIFDGLAPRRFDLIISNPPYVDAPAMAALPAEYLAEPASGLTAGPAGLDCVDKILAGAPDFLSDRGVVIVEVGDSEAAVADAYGHLPLTWLQMSDGSSGIFLITGKELNAFASERR